MQIEPRLLAHMSNDELMKAAYIQGRDLYTEMAMNVFKLDHEYCIDGAYDPTGTYKPRKVIKAILLGIMYGMGSKTLAESVDITEERADEIIAEFMETYKGVAAYIEERHKHAEQYEYVSTILGRKRRFPNHKQNAAKFNGLMAKAKTRLGREANQFIWNEPKLDYRTKQAIWDVGKSVLLVQRQSVNATIQGSGADLMKYAMIKVYEYCVKMGFLIVATVHDEVLIEIPEDTPIEVINELVSIMKNCYKLSVPMKVDPEISYRWGEGMDLDTFIKVRQGEKVTKEEKGYTLFYDYTTHTWKEDKQHDAITI